MLGAHAAFVDSTPTEVKIFIWIKSPLWSKKTSAAATDERNIIILHRKIVNIEPIYEVYCIVWRRYICYLSILFWGCLDGVMVKDVRHCNARRACRIRGFNPHRSRNIYMDYVSTVVEKDKCRCYAAFVGSTPTEVEIFIWIMSPLWSKKTSVAATDERNIIILHRQTAII